MDAPSIKLSHIQEKVITWDNGPLLVLSGPNSGKMEILTHRIASMINSTPREHFWIVVLSSTSKTVDEIHRRVRPIAPKAEKRTVLTTFYSFAAELLRRNYHHAGLDRDFTIITHDRDRCALLNEAIQHAQHRLYIPDITAEKLLPVISLLMERDVATENLPSVMENVSIEYANIVSSIYRKYCSLMIEKNSLDSAGLIKVLIDMYDNKPYILTSLIQCVYRRIWVDGFQDITPIEYKFLKTLIAPEHHKNLLLFADDDQLTYHCNGVSLSTLQKDFNASVLHLPENSRCPPAIMMLSNRLVKQEPYDHEKKNNIPLNNSRLVKQVSDHHNEEINLIVNSESIFKHQVTVKKFDDFDQEVEWITDQIRKHPLTEHNQCLVLSESKTLLTLVAASLEGSKIAVDLGAYQYEFESAALRWLHSVLRLANSRSSMEYLRLVCRDFCSLENIQLDINDIRLYSAIEDGDYLRCFQRIALMNKDLSSEMKRLMTESFSRLIDSLDYLSFQRTACALFDHYHETNVLSNDMFDHYAVEKEIWTDLVQAVISQHGDHPSLHLFLRELHSRSRTSPLMKDAVSCWTIRESRGKEFNHVYLIGMVEDVLPTSVAVGKGKDSFEMQRSRKNCFVAMTQAKKTLGLSYSSRIHGVEMSPSRFLYEMGLLDSEFDPLSSNSSTPEKMNALELSV